MWVQSRVENNLGLPLRKLTVHVCDAPPALIYILSKMHVLSEKQRSEYTRDVLKQKRLHVYLSYFFKILVQ